MAESADRTAARTPREVEIVPSVTPTSDDPRLVLLDMNPTARFWLAPYRARALGRELIRVADEIVGEARRGR